MVMAENAIDSTIPETYRVSPSTDEEDGVPIDLLEVVRTLLRGRRTILGVSFGSLAIATVVAFLLRPSYTSTVSFIPPSVGNSNPMVSAVAGQLSALGAGDILGAVKNPGDMYVGVLR